MIESEVGGRIRTLREAKGLSLRALSEKSGLSLNAISRIEKGDSSPTVSSLHQLAEALGVSITEFFEDEDDRSTVFLRPEQRLQSLSNGTTMESLGSGLTNQQLEPFMIQIDPGAGNLDEPITHPGEECVYCLEGKVSYCVGERIYEMTPGCSLIFDATQPHAFHNPGEKPAQMILVFQAKGNLDIVRQRHLDYQSGD